ncbi:rare lipoprotein A [Pontibacter ummariensis]|uniref:Probable endolytic peptidoglycan transglycosylase RlpA n=1 Tax=Pontibacter ummariensis TaxID=1610492 RepID=A0A239C5N2_9BACT|nr:septal ring lytic transglycosylase RlpA family protein [Pontibacter ummariensis]PRY15429.1 rare lipoprotein A [Pontibacter ummariensis]SNS15557.1 rare lipoprotein A [Pontibacter ummariensis]
MNICSIVLIFILSFFTSPTGYTAEGKASYYADRLQGHRTTSGERYDKNLLTAAHATLPLHTTVQVTNLRNGKSVVVRINDRKAKNRYSIIDLSRAAAQELDMIQEGTAQVRLREVKSDELKQQVAVGNVSEAEILRKD